MQKAFVFDFDGTLIDSETHWPVASRLMYKNMTGKDWLEEDQRRLVGQGMKEAYAIMQRYYGITMSFDAYIRTVESHCLDIYGTKALLMPGVLDVIVRLQARRVPLAIASAGYRTWILSAARRLDIERFFPVICSSEDVIHSKPHPDLYLLAAEKLGLLPADCIAIEDSNPGLTSAKTAGMFCIAYHTQHNDTQDLSAADLHIHHFDELTGAKLQSLLA